ncbi:MAG: diaminopimelate decarboxylase [Halodesulfurarchaeum sp.]
MNPEVRRVIEWPTERLEAVAADVGTPAYVIDLDRIRENLKRFRSSFPGAGIHYAVKANAGAAVLETLAEAGIGAEAASAGEFQRAVAAGFSPADLLYTPVNPPARDLDAVLASDGEPLAITVGSMDTIERLADRGYRGRVSIRIHPGTGAGHGEDVATGADVAFGIPRDRVEPAVESAEDAAMDVFGLHAHAGSGMLDGDLPAHREVVEQLAAVAGDLDRSLDFVDVGGGFGVPYRFTEEPLDLEAAAAATREALAGVDADLRVEPGRYLVADAGVLLTRVNTIKPAGDGIIAGVDAGMTDLLRPALYDAYHPIAQVGPSGTRDGALVTVVGPICESTDVLAERRQLPRPRRGDLLAVGMTGAYGIEMASQYNSRPRAPVVALDGDDTSTVRRRERIADLTRAEEP